MDKTEKEVANKAQKMLTAALQSQIGSLGFKEHISKEGQKKISLAKGVSSGKYGKGFTDDKRYFLNKISVSMPHHGFVLEHGVDRVRAGTFRERNGTKYSVRAHDMRMEPKPFLRQAIEHSGVVNYVMDAITEIRGNEVAFSIFKELDFGK